MLYYLQCLFPLGRNLLTMHPRLPNHAGHLFRRHLIHIPPLSLSGLPLLSRRGPGSHPVPAHPWARARVLLEKSGRRYVDYLQIFPHILLWAPLEEGMHRARPANDHRDGCSARDYKISRRTGVTGVTGPRANMCRFPRMHTEIRTQRLEGTELHCAFIRLWCRQISSLERAFKNRKETGWPC